MATLYRAGADRQMANPDPREPLQAGDELVLVGDADTIAQMAARGVAG